MTETARLDAMLRVTASPHEHALAVMSVSACQGWARLGRRSAERVADVLAWVTERPDTWAAANYAKGSPWASTKAGSTPSPSTGSETSSSAPTGSATGSSSTPGTTASA